MPTFQQFLKSYGISTTEFRIVPMEKKNADETLKVCVYPLTPENRVGLAKDIGIFEVVGNEVTFVSSTPEPVQEFTLESYLSQGTSFSVNCQSLGEDEVRFFIYPVGQNNETRNFAVTENQTSVV